MNFKERQEIIAKSPISFGYLRKFNVGAGILQLINGIAILALTFALTWPKGTDIYTFYLSFAHVSPTNQPSLLHLTRRYSSQLAILDFCLRLSH